MSMSLLVSYGGLHIAKKTHNASHPHVSYQPLVSPLSPPYPPSSLFASICLSDTLSQTLIDTAHF
jgi:hypothetical protein